MKHFKKIIGIFLLAVMLGVFSMHTVRAASEFRSGDTVSVPKNKAIDGSLYIAGNNTTIRGTVDGDVFCAGQNVTINALVKGDVLCVGQNIRFEGKVEGDVRMAGQNIILAGEVEKSATLAGQSITVEKSGKIGRDLTVTGTQLVFSGVVVRDAIISTDTSTLEGKIGRDTVKNKFDSSQPQSADISLFATWFYTALALLLVSFVLASLFPRHLEQTGARIDNHPLKTFVVGLTTSIVVPIFIFLLSITLVGIPLAVLFLFVWISILFVSGPVTGVAIGKLLLRDKVGIIGTALIGGLALITLYFVPLLGLLILLFAPIFGIGAIAIELYHRMGTSRVVSPAKNQTKKKK